MDKKHHDELRLSLVRKFCVPLFQKMSVTNQISIFMEQISSLMTLVNSEIPVDVDHYQRKTTLLEKTCAFNFLESLYTLLPAPTIKDRINSQFHGKSDAKGNEVILFVINLTL